MYLKVETVLGKKISLCCDYMSLFLCNLDETLLEAHGSQSTLLVSMELITSQGTLRFTVFQHQYQM